MSTARDVVEQQGEAINDRDLDAYRATMNFPFTYQNYNGVALTMESEADLRGSVEALPWNIILSTDPRWHHTIFDVIEEVAASVSSAVFKLTFRRVNEAGEASSSYRAIWIATDKDGHWGVQFRHNLGLLEE